MSGLIKNNLTEELLTEISWLKQAVTIVSENLNLSAYVLCLIKYHVEPEEARSIERILFYTYKEINNLDFSVVRDRIAKDFFESTQKEWTLSDNILKELWDLKLDEVSC